MCGTKFIKVGTTLSETERKEITEGLVRMGFRSSHVDEALEYCSDTAMALDWLCKFLFFFFLLFLHTCKS